VNIVEKAFITGINGQPTSGCIPENDLLPANTAKLQNLKESPQNMLYSKCHKWLDKNLNFGKKSNFGQKSKLC